MEHRRDVPGGDLWAYTPSGFSRGQKSAVGRAGVWILPRDGAQDVGLFDPAGLPAERVSEVSQAGAVDSVIDAILEEDKSKPVFQAEPARAHFNTDFNTGVAG